MQGALAPQQSFQCFRVSNRCVQEIFISPKFSPENRIRPHTLFPSPNTVMSSDANSWSSPELVRASIGDRDKTRHCQQVEQPFLFLEMAVCASAPYTPPTPALRSLSACSAPASDRAATISTPRHSAAAAPEVSLLADDEIDSTSVPDTDLLRASNPPSFFRGAQGVAEHAGRVPLSSGRHSPQGYV